MAENEIKEQVDAFVALPRAERRAAYNSLPEEVQKEARAVLEARRGIAKRVDGHIVHSQEVYEDQLVRLALKERDLKKRMEKLPKRVEALKRDLSAHYGEDALTEAQAAVVDAILLVEKGEAEAVAANV